MRASWSSSCARTALTPRLPPLADFAGAKITGQLNTFHYTVIDQIPDVQKQTGHGHLPDDDRGSQFRRHRRLHLRAPRRGERRATNPDLTYVEFADGQGFETDPADTSIAIGVAKGSELTAKINEALATISDEERLQIMETCWPTSPARSNTQRRRAASGAGKTRRGLPRCAER